MILTGPSKISMLLTSMPFMWCVAGYAQSLPSTSASASENDADNSLADEIIVLGRRAEATKVKFRVSGKSRRVSCKITKSSGDTAVDATVCEAIRLCAQIPELTPPKFEACLLEKGQELRRALAIRRIDRKKTD